MDILVNVANQKLKIATNLKSLVAGTQEFVRFVFNLTGDWDNLMTFAQFRQNGVAYNQYLDENNSAYLPSEIGTGTCTIMLYGSNGNTIATTNYLTILIDENILVSDAESTDISLSLYNQLVSKVNALTTGNDQNYYDLQAADKDLQIQINKKADSLDLTNEISRAKAAEKANADAIALKASQSEVDELTIKVTQLENNEVVANLVSEAVTREMNEYLESGKLAEMTIADKSLKRAKVDADFEATLVKADSAMQPSIYDPQGLRIDIFSYAQSKADTVQKNLNDVKEEIRDAYTLTDTLVYTKIGDAIRGAVTLSRTYAQALLADYKAFTIKIVDVLPTTGEAMTFYLVPNKAGTGYDKYWWITDNNGDAKWDVFGSATTLVVTELPEVGDEDTDYILKSKSGCLYYKYIDGYWEVVAGSLAYVSATLPDVENGNSFTDYYIVNEEGSYIHYRFINGEYRVIGGNSYTKDEINSFISTLEESVGANEQEISNVSTNLQSLSKTVDKIRSDVDNLDTEGNSYYHTIVKDEDTGNYILTLYEVHGANESIASQTVLPATGGGGGGSSTTTNLVVDRITASPLIITTTDSAIIEIDFSSTDADGEMIDAIYTWKSGSTTIMTGALVQGRNSFDLSDYVSVGTQKFTLTVVDEGGSTVVKSWTVQKVDVRIESSFSDKYTTAIGRSVSFTYTPYGAVNKTVHFKLDGVEETLNTSASGTLQSYTIPTQSHGAHMLEVWITATINNIEVETSHIYKDIIWYDDTQDEDGNYRDAVIGCIYRNDYYGKVNARQYDTTAITYNVYDPTTNYPVVKRYIDDELVSTDTLSSSQAVWNYKSDDVGEHTLKIVCRNTTVTIIMNIVELGIDVSPITGGLEIDFNPTGTTNSSANRVWSNEKYKMAVSDNFDWANGGYRTDENGDTYFLVKAGTSISFDYLMFSGGLDANPSILGSEMKIVFMTENVQDANAVWFSNVETTTSEVNGETISTKVGIQMGVHEGWLKTNNASDSDVKSGDDDSSETVAATNTYLYMPYSEEDIIEMDINIDTLNRDDETAMAFVMAYEDGVPSKAYVYDSGDRFYQYNPQPITIGSDYCDIRIYRLKIYSTSLSTEGIMRNFIADSRDSTTMLKRYDRNSVYYNKETNKYTPYSGEGVLDPEKLAAITPNVKILMLDTDHFTTSKKVFVKSNLRCIHASGGEVYPGDEYYDNWYFENGYHSGQGTTSDNYGNAGRNVDFLFNADGIHKPSDKVSAEAGYISQVTLGFNTENATVEKVTDWKGDTGKVTLTRTSIPNNFFNLKVNIASSENVNNALLQKRYNDYLPYISPAKKRNEFTKNDMEFVPAILFIRENNPDINTHNEFLDTEWHFYALGNIGDSKKTDYTRAYDPEDMNEFVIEISDNTKNNATFQTGVYLDSQGKRQIETFTIAEDGSPVSVEKPSAFVYPITKAEWEDERNMRHWALYNEAFDGDHSFEPRYACCGDYRDGKLVNDTSGRGKEQVVINAKVWRAFYRWVITSTDEEFVNELDEWCVRSAVEFFYAFTHIYTMMDNRAKNTFWHFAKTGTYRAVSKPVEELLHVYCEKNGDTYTPTSDVSIVSGKTYYTEYAFDLWDYDNDTALGINNNGELIFPYGKEDSDYNIEGNPSSGYVFNGATSVFWCRLRDLLPNEIRNMFANTVASECFSAVNLINQFDAYQECYPEEIWRLDIQRKYIRTFTGESVDNSKPKHDVQYLRDMMQGRKKYQRRQWVRDQEAYFGTMNLMNTVVGDDNRITFRCFTPTGDDVVVKPDYTLKITPYSDMYLSVMFGNGGTQQIRAKGGKEYTIDCPLSTMDDTQVTIYGANRIQALSDLSACYIAANNFSMASRLRKLVLGNTTPGYNNSRLTSLTLGSNKLLEELDIRNCGNLTGSINLSQCNNLLKLYAEGTKLTGVTFATNGKVQVAHLPDTINTLTMRNLNNLIDFDAVLDRLETLTLQGGTLDSLEIITNTINTLQVLYLYDINWTVADTALLNKMLKLFHSLVTGYVYISGQIRQQELNNYAKAWNDLEVGYDSTQMVTQYLVTYVNYDGTVLYEEYVDRGSTPSDPVSTGAISTPVRPSTAQYDFTFSGWDEIDSSTLAPRTVTAQYDETVRQYTVTWYARQGLSLKTVVANYGDEVVYDGAIPTRTDEESTYVYNVFTGWDKSTGFIKGDTDVYAIWDRGELPATGTDLKDMSLAQIYGVTSTGRAANYFEDKDYIDIPVGTDFDFSNVESRVLAENLALDGSKAIDTGIKLFAEDSPSFTLVVDYQFTGTDVNNTLVSCYEEDGTEGFRLRYNSNPGIQWGNVTQKVALAKQRDVVVLRHVAGSNKLFVYGFNTDAASLRFADTASQFELTRTRNTVSDATLVLGAVKFADGGYDYYGSGVIHWAKIWFDDLGDNNAKQLAYWFHETWRAEYTGTGRYRLSGGTSAKTNATFILNHELLYRHVMNTQNTNVGGWDGCEMRTFLANRVYYALPIGWRNILKKHRVTASAGNQSNELVVSEDYITLACQREMNNTATSPYVDESDYHISWFIDNPSRCKFHGRIIPDDATYYSTNTDPTTVSTNQVKEGDVWINTSTNDKIGYIFVTQDTIDKYKLTTDGDDGYKLAFKSTSGGWVRACVWWLRSPNTGGTTNFWYVSGNGYVYYGNYGALNAFGVVPCFSI